MILVFANIIKQDENHNGGYHDNKNAFNTFDAIFNHNVELEAPKVMQKIMGSRRGKCMISGTVT